ncbi:MAG: PspC domain-containing protein [Anaerolineaceae bacterium]|nr:PspC domain-containing protein [Anaerolineaceae bacterium]
MNNDRKLTRSQNDRMIAGVCSGIGEYLDLDPTIVRLVFVVLLFLGGHGLLIYFILLIIMPIEPIATQDTALPTTKVEE